MNTNEFIRLLQDADPDGELNIAIEGSDVFSVFVADADWGGNLEVLEREETDFGCTVTSAKITDQGAKLVITIHSIEEAIWVDPDLDISVEISDRNKRAAVSEEIDSVRLLVRSAEEDTKEWIEGLDD